MPPMPMPMPMSILPLPVPVQSQSQSQTGTEMAKGQTAKSEVGAQKPKPKPKKKRPAEKKLLQSRTVGGNSQRARMERRRKRPGDVPLLSSGASLYGVDQRHIKLLLDTILEHVNLKEGRDVSFDWHVIASTVRSRIAAISNNSGGGSGSGRGNSMSSNPVVAAWTPVACAKLWKYLAYGELYTTSIDEVRELSQSVKQFEAQQSQEKGDKGGSAVPNVAAATAAPRAEKLDDSFLKKCTDPNSTPLHTTLVQKWLLGSDRHYLQGGSGNGNASKKTIRPSSVKEPRDDLAVSLDDLPSSDEESMVGSPEDLAYGRRTAQHRVLVVKGAPSIDNPLKRKPIAEQKQKKRPLQNKPKTPKLGNDETCHQSSTDTSAQLPTFQFEAPQVTAPAPAQAWAPLQAQQFPAALNQAGYVNQVLQQRLLQQQQQLLKQQIQLEHIRFMRQAAQGSQPSFTSPISIPPVPTIVDDGAGGSGNVCGGSQANRIISSISSTMRPVLEREMDGVILNSLMQMQNEEILRLQQEQQQRWQQQQRSMPNVVSSVSTIGKPVETDESVKMEVGDKG